MREDPCGHMKVACGTFHVILSDLVGFGTFTLSGLGRRAYVDRAVTLRWLG